VALAVAHLHKNKIIHRDVKSLNILVTDDFGAKLTDFGMDSVHSRIQDRVRVRVRVRVQG
jgi:serine/threonine protein kinase